MNIEANRLSSFAHWPVSTPVDPITIARAGFFYSGSGTEVECFSCGGKISDWNYGDQAMRRHRLIYPNCSFVVTPQLSGNVPCVVGQGFTRSDGNSTERHLDHQIYRSDQVATGQFVSTQEDLMYRNDALRLLSYVDWDDSHFAREALVYAGFYHVGGGRLRCAWCGGELESFNNMEPHLPLDIHLMFSPMCEYAIQRARMDNIPIQEAPENVDELLEFAVDTSQPEVTTAPQSSGAVLNEQVVAAGSTWKDLGIVSGGARHLDKVSLATRLATFDRWPCERPQDPNLLAEAGFFYTGRADQVRCFYCDGGLGTWEAGDIPWQEHARWFPQCGYVLLMKGQQFVDTARVTNRRRTVSSANRSLSSRPRNPRILFAVTEHQIDNCLESSIAADALGAGLDAARVRRAIVRRLQSTGSPFPNSESLIDAVLDEQLNEESWTVSTQRFARDILAETLRAFDTSSRALNLDEDRSNSIQSSESSSVSPLPENPPSVQVYNLNATKERPKTPIEKPEKVEKEKELTLEEENRQLKEARLCKVCMDNEVSMVFLPCGHLVSCAACSTALTACPLCRASVKALVRAYFA